MKYKVFLLSVWLIVLVICPAFAQIKQIKGVKYSKQREIRKFAFLNSTYESCAGGKVKVRNGHYSPKNSSEGYFEIDVLVSYGDLTGDNIEEVIVVTQCSGAVQNYDEGKIYSVKNHRLVKLTELEIGTKNGGSILDAKIRNRRLIVTRGPSPNLCTEVENAVQKTATFRLLANNKLQKIGKSICKTI